MLVHCPNITLQLADATEQKFHTLLLKEAFTGIPASFSELLLPIERVLIIIKLRFLFELYSSVHQFTKVEMFGVCMPHQSESTLELFRSIQEELFSSYELHYRVIDMAPSELAHNAHRKYDIEAWMPGLNRYGEISSCSNCLDYQVNR